MLDNNQEQQKMSMTQDEADEYLRAIQSGKHAIPDDGGLEYEAYKRLMTLQRQIREMTNQKNAAEKEVARAQAQIEQLDRDINGVSGEMSGYAQLLLSAEGKRRDATAKAEEKENLDEKAAEMKELAAPKPKGNGKVTTIKAKSKKADDAPEAQA